MPIFKCPIDDCTYQTEDIDAGVAVAMLTIHNNVHLASNPTDDDNQRDPKIERPKISAGSDEETWNTFLTRWTMFKRNRKVKGTACVEQLFYCCEEDLGDSILRGHPNAVTGTEANLMKLRNDGHPCCNQCTQSWTPSRQPGSWRECQVILCEREGESIHLRPRHQVHWP